MKKISLLLLLGFMFLNGCHFEMFHKVVDVNEKARWDREDRKERAEEKSRKRNRNDDKKDKKAANEENRSSGEEETKKE